MPHFLTVRATIADASKRMEPEFQSKNEVTDWYMSKRELGK